MGIWAQAVNDKGHVLTGAVSGGQISEQTNSQYNVLGAVGMGTSSSITYNGLISNVIPTISPNAVSMGYADQNVVYSNEDTKLTAPKTPSYITTSNTNLNLVPQSSIAAGGNVAVQAGQNELFPYSIVNAANPNGISKAVFF